MSGQCLTSWSCSDSGEHSCRGGSTDVDLADLLNGLPDAGLEHPLDRVHRRSLILFHFYAAPRFLPFVLDGQRQAIAEPFHTLEHTLTRLHDHGADLNQQLRRPYMGDRPSKCSGNVSEFHQGSSLIVLEGEAGQPRPQWTAAQDDPPNGTPREAMPQCAATAPPKTSQILLATAWLSSPKRV